MKYAIVLLLVLWLAAFFPRKQLEDGQHPTGMKEKVAYAVLAAVGVCLCILQQWETFPAIAHWMDTSMMAIYRLTGGGTS
jgi:hypothetical protein